eukprot:scaffold34215_cov17-Tisochrysis_lutea.AAC.1
MFNCAMGSSEVGSLPLLPVLAKLGASTCGVLIAERPTAAWDVCSPNGELKCGCCANIYRVQSAMF